LYAFHPADLDEAGQTRKSAELDAFWKRIGDAGPAGLEALRTELAADGVPSFFHYDGAQLLLSLSHERADRALALRAIARAPLADVNPAAWFDAIHAFAVDGFDTSDAALRILEDDGFRVFVPEHALTLGQDYALLYLVLPTDERYYVDKLVARLATETRPVAQRSLLRVLAYVVSPAADAAVLAFANDASRPAETRQFAAKLAALAADTATPADLEAIKRERRVLLRTVSDEALEALETLQARLRPRARSA
jgi:hypothetical protein